MAKKEESIAFLQFVASAVAPPTLIPVTLPSLVPPPSKDTASPISPSGPQPPTQSAPTKAQILQEYRISKGCTHISEGSLLRDALYLLQGISGKRVKISSDEEEDGRIVFLGDAVRALFPVSLSKKLIYPEKYHISTHQGSHSPTGGSWISL